MLFRSLAQAFGRNAAALVLTGMGSDGADGLIALEAAGGLPLIEDPDSAVIPGMPEAARRAVRRPIVQPTEALPALLRRLLQESA